MNNGAKSFDWGPLMDAITQVESEGDSRAVSGNSCGAMQITPILVKDCNAILKKRGEKKRYTLNDRFSVKKSREMFVLIMSHYNPTNNIERAIRLWNGGVKYTTKGTQNYYNKVMKLYR
ncbi:MAG: transglycosylase SLT domain-containing protein [Prevotellaceae bacterium]|nr:transglycosylase SLT domain-containing protein [Prevotellaceae bacterium]MDY2748937.1 transglycosylase SLT domain-containing protein [Prevotella sp.]